MTEPENTGYQDSPDTTDPAGAPAGTDEGSATLTTDDDAQQGRRRRPPGQRARLNRELGAHAPVDHSVLPVVKLLCADAR